MHFICIIRSVQCSHVFCSQKKGTLVLQLTVTKQSDITQNMYKHAVHAIMCSGLSLTISVLSGSTVPSIFNIFCEQSCADQRFPSPMTLIWWKSLSRLHCPAMKVPYLFFWDFRSVRCCFKYEIWLYWPPFSCVVGSGGWRKVPIWRIGVGAGWRTVVVLTGWGHIWGELAQRAIVHRVWNQFGH